MRNISIIITILMVVGVAQSQYAAGNKIIWHNFQKGAYLAKKDQKPMMLYIYTDYCGYCKKMEREILANQKIIKALNAHYISVSVNATDYAAFKKQVAVVYKEKTGEMLHQLVGKGGVPRTVFLDKDGKLLAAFPGYGDSFKNAFLDLLGYIKDRCYVIDFPFNQYQAKGHCKKGK